MRSVTLSYRRVVQDAIIYIDPDNPVNLQNQIRQKIVDGIINGAFPPGMKLPSSRKLSQQLAVARNTVVAAYQQLIIDGADHYYTGLQDVLIKRIQGWLAKTLPPPSPAAALVDTAAAKVEAESGE